MEPGGGLVNGNDELVRCASARLDSCGPTSCPSPPFVWLAIRGTRPYSRRRERHRHSVGESSRHGGHQQAQGQGDASQWRQAMTVPSRKGILAPPSSANRR